MAAALLAKDKYPTCSSIPFEFVVDFFERASKKTAGEQKKDRERLLKRFSQHYINREADDIFQLYRLLLPDHDRVRSAYRLKETSLASVLVDACAVARNSETAKAVLNWKKPPVEHAGDLSAVAEEVESPAEALAVTGYTVGDLNDDLDRLAAAERNSDKAKELKSIIVKTSSTQMKWITRIILMNLRVGLSEDLLLSEFHQDARKLYNSTMDLRRVCIDLKDRSVRCQIKDIDPGTPAKAQLAKRENSVPDILKCMRSKEFVVEVKFDGERCQLHKIGDRIMYYSRNGIDHGDRSNYNTFNTVVNRQVIKDICVLDGELVIWNKLNCCFEPFGSLRATVKTAVEGLQGTDPVQYDDFRDTSDDKRIYQLPDLDQLEFVYVAFDVLYVNDTSVTQLPLFERHRLLRTAIQDAPMDGIAMRNGLRGRMVPLLPDQTFMGGYSLSKKGDSLHEIVDMFNQSIAMQEEGIVVKAMDSVWLVNDKSEQWVKMKPDYVYNHEIDAVVIGGYYGRGKQGNKVSEYLLGILDTAETEKPYVSFCRVGTGLSDKERSDLESLINPLFKKLKRPPKWYRLSGHHKETPDEWITDPTSSAVLEVKAEIRTIRTEVFASGYTLRFPRVTRLRLDKGSEDIMTVQELNETVRLHSGNLLSRKRGADTPAKTPKSRKRMLTAPPHLSMTPAKKRETYGGCLLGEVVCFTDYGVHGKEKLESMAQELGAVVYMTASKECDYVLGANPNNQNLKRTVYHGRHDVISVEWLIKCHEVQSKVPLRPKDYLYRSLKSASKLTNLLKCEDPGADLEVEDVEQIVEQQLAQDIMTLKHRQTMDSIGLSCEELPKQEIFPGSTLLESCRFCILTVHTPHAEPVPEDCLLLSVHSIQDKWKQLRKQCNGLQVASKLLFAGAEFFDCLTPSVSHILVDAAASTTLQSPEDFLQMLSNQESPAVDFYWLKEALTLQRLMIVNSDWLETQDRLEDVMDANSVYSYPPAFLQSSIVSTSRTRDNTLCVEHWPWEAYISEESSSFKTPVKRTRQEASPSATKRITDSAMSKTPWKQARKRGKVQRKASPELALEEPEVVTTPRGKKTRPASPIPSRVSKRATRQAEKSTPKKKARFNVFDLVMGEDSDVMQDLEPEKPPEKETVMDATPMKKTRMRLRSHSPEALSPEEPTPKKRVSVRDKLRALKR